MPESLYQRFSISIAFLLGLYWTSNSHVHPKTAGRVIIKHNLIYHPSLGERTKLSISGYGYAILYAAMLVSLEAHCHPTYLTLQLVTEYELNVSYLRIWVCISYAKLHRRNIPIWFLIQGCESLLIMILLHTSYLRASCMRSLYRSFADCQVNRLSSCRWGEIRTSTFM